MKPFRVFLDETPEQLASFHRTRASHYKALLAKEKHPALKNQWGKRLKHHLDKAQRHEMRI